MTTTELKTKDGRLVGILKGSVLYKRVKGSKHKFNAIGDNGSWGIDYDVLMNQLPQRCSVYITDTENQTIYMAPASRWKDYGEIKHFKEKTQDHYTQVFLPLEYFDKTTSHGV